MTTAPDRPATDEAIDLVELYRRMVTIREFDTVVPRLVQMGRIKGTAHSAVGQEAVAVGACTALRATTSSRARIAATATHREGRRPSRMMAELLGRATGILPRQGRLHAHRRLLDRDPGRQRHRRRRHGDRRRVGALRGSRQTGDICFFGDGALNQGALHESSNYAAIWALPVILLCENNHFAMSMPAARATPPGDRGSAAGIPMPGVTVDGMGVLAVYDAVPRPSSELGQARAHADRRRLLPLRGHHVGDPEIYRTPEDASPWRKSDPIAAFRGRLLEPGALTPDGADAIDAEVAAEIEAAIDAAERAPFPEPDDAFTDIYA